MLHPGPTPASGAVAGQPQPKGKAKARAKPEAATIGTAVPESPTAVVDRPDLAHQGNGEGKRG